MTARGYLTLGAAVLGLLVLTEVGRRVLVGRCRDHPLPHALLRRCTAPLLVTAAAVGGQLGLVRTSLAPHTRDDVHHALGVVLVAAGTWLAVQAVYAVTDAALVRVDRAVTAADNRRARRLRTQLMLLRRILAAIAVVLAVGAILLSFARVRAFGASLLASAGIIGVVGGVAARSTLGNLFAGLQLTFSDALRIDDVVVVEDEWGRVEEITLTYVVVRLWDERRLILPSTYFTDNPFQNWTRHSARVIGSVYLRVDWTVPVEELREQARRAIDASPLWDRRDWVLQVTDITEGGMVEIRVLMSAADAPSAWDLRCEVRERLVGFLRERYPDALPRLRTELVAGAVPDGWAARYGGAPYGDDTDGTRGRMYDDAGRRG